MCIRDSAKADDFNPHEREARDRSAAECEPDGVKILIHTSVKLVT